MSNASLIGSIPASFGNLVNLVQLRLQDNNLSGHLPARIGFLTSLEFLDLSHNQFCVQIPDSVQRLGHLLLLDLSHNSFCGKIPNSMKKSLQRLLKLDLSHNKLSGEIPVGVAMLPAPHGLFFKQQQPGWSASPRNPNIMLKSRFWKFAFDYEKLAPMVPEISVPNVKYSSFYLQTDGVSCNRQTEVQLLKSLDTKTSQCG
ncbi:hypothetical protein CcCBS67573_g01035 [Chytriomyces confervae]|uniref:Uncharacterized protein n=1 Tax=Chytriomyces confervae TaxID=246404 RepID=A0A507FPP7_9FUNG|nr:hypothetical protein CcCBS67573_g01035 [Chytriomyces confervae]